MAGLLKCCCDLEPDCKTPFNCYQGGAFDGELYDFRVQAGALVPISQSSTNIVDGITVDLLDTQTEARLISTSFSYTQGTGLENVTLVNYNVEIDISYAADLDLPPFGGGNCQCETGAYTAPPLFLGVMNFSGTVQYQCYQPNPGSPTVPRQNWVFVPGPSYNMAPDSGCTKFGQQSFLSKLNAITQAAPPWRDITSCSGLILSPFTMAFNLAIPSSASGCLTTPFNSTAPRLELYLDLGFKVV